MRYGKRLFPYPTLNREKGLSQYVNSSFSLDYDSPEDSDNLVLANAKYSLDNEYLMQLVSGGKARALLVVDCPVTHYRHSFDLSDTPNTISIPMSELNGKVNISAYLIATQDIFPFKPVDLSPDYAGFEDFVVEKYDVIAIDDGFVQKVTFDEEKDNIEESIFTIIGDKTIKDEIMRVELHPDKIVVCLPEDVWVGYTKTRKLEAYKDIAYSLVLVPALEEAIDKVKSELTTIDAAVTNYQWFESICSQYKNVYGKELVEENLRDEPSTVMAQKLLACPTTKAVTTVFALVSGLGKGDVEDE